MAIPLRGLHRSAGASGAGAWSAGCAGCASAAAALLPGKALENYWILWIFHNLPLLSLFLLEITIFNGKTHYKWPFSIAMLNYQRVPLLSLFLYVFLSLFCFIYSFITHCIFLEFNSWHTFLYNVICPIICI